MDKSDKQRVNGLNALLAMHSNRLRFYADALDATEVPVLRDLFLRLQHASAECHQDLTHEIFKLGGTPASGPAPSREAFDAWITMRKSIRRDHPATLRACETIETLTVLAYAEELRAEIYTTLQRQMIERQMSRLADESRFVSNLLHVAVAA